MAYYREFADTPAGEVLKAIQVRGQASIKELAADLGITPSAVRQHLIQLQTRDAIRTKVRKGVGRPYHIYSATPQVHNLFYSDYGELAQLVLEEVISIQGGRTLQRLLRRVSDRLAAKYRDQVWGHELADRLAAWAQLLDNRGVSAEIEKTKDGYVLHEYGCPYQNVATENHIVCELERQVIARLLESGVKLTQCILDGHRSCQFAISEPENMSNFSPSVKEKP
jgi:predicted ArsR family transcriptional regulator